jgi:hypothetical protein
MKLNLPTIATISAAATATAATTAATATATATATAATATSAAEAASLGPLFGLIDAQGPSVEGRTVHGFDCLLGLRRRPHGNEAKASRLARGSVRHDMYVRDFSNARKGLAHGLVGGRK